MARGRNRVVAGSHAYVSGGGGDMAETDEGAHLHREQGNPDYRLAMAKASELGISSP